MKLSLMLLLVFVLVFSITSGLLSNACKNKAEVCRAQSECCPVMGRRMVCSPHLEICGKKTCCITEVEEQQEKQAAIIRNRNPKLKRFWNELFNEE
ncbi:unnamed protein product [Adineta steineri]|uniref:Uncharacterized protein n=1 Tax=Adineta steineri TaxID=433720 RepID=A0A819XPV1_9BILA|nr:unnamed protein product [Adineta steineri]CAF4145666.1 unnamed protein product [Adineta steineri]